MKRSTALLFAAVALSACSDVIPPPSPSPVSAVDAPRAAVGATYTAVDLGSLGGTYGQAFVINDAGQVGGISYLADGTQGAFRWESGVMSQLRSLGGDHSAPNAINTAGDIAGWSFLSGNLTQHATLWRGGTATDLGKLPGDLHSYATALNDRGQVVAVSTGHRFSGFLWDNGVVTELIDRSGATTSPNAINSAGEIVGFSYRAPGAAPRAVLWRGGSATYLPALPLESESGALDINNAGQVAGYSTYFSFYHAVRWDNGVVTDLGTLGGDVSYAQAINSNGDVAGWSTLPDGNVHAVLWRNGVMTDLGDLDGGPNYSVALDVNDAGQVTGHSFGLDGQIRAFLWENGVMTDLGTLGGRFGMVWTPRTSLNNHGQVVGSSELTPFGDERPTLWTPAEVAVTVDIKASVNPKSKGVIPLAILSVGGFDATTIDVATVRFGPGGAREAHGKGHVGDVNGDGVADLLLHFDTQASGIDCGATSTTLTGSTVGGTQIRANVTVRCK